MKNLSLFFAALVAVLFSVAETSAQITPPFYNPANVRITGGTINGTAVGATTQATGAFSTLTANTLFTVGSGATTNAGFIFGYGGVSGSSAIWHTGVTPSVTNYAFTATTAGAAIGGASASYMAVGNVLKISNSATLTTIDNPVSVTNTTDSSSTTTGSLKTAGGLGVAKKAYFGETITTTGAIYGGTTTGSNVGLFIYKNTSTGVTNDSAVFIRQDGTDDIAKFTKASGVNVASINSSGLYVDSPGTIRVGSGSTTSAGLIAGYLGLSGYGAIWSTGVTPSATNYAFQASATTSTMNGSSAVSIAVADSNKLVATSTGVQLVGTITLDKTITTPGTTGAQTINKTTGRVNFAAAATSLVVTNSLVTANSIVHCTVATNDTTMKSAACVPTAGSFTIYGNAAATAETAVAFTVTN